MAGTTHSKYFKSYYNGNVKATKILVAHFENLNIKHFIFLSSNTADKDSGGYGLSKLMAEKVIIGSSIPFTILRISEVYGEGMAGFDFLKKIINLPIFTFYPFSNKIKFCPIFIDDVYKIINKLILSKAKNKTYLVAGPYEYSFKEICELLSEYYGQSNIFIPIPILVIKIIAFCNLILEKPFIYPDQVARLINYKSNDIKLLKKDFNFNPKPIEDLIEKL